MTMPTKNDHVVAEEHIPVPPPKDDIDFMGPFLSVEKCPIMGPEDEVCTACPSDEDEEEPENEANPEQTAKGEGEEEEEHWGWTAARYCGIGLITLAILFDEMD